MLRGGRPWGLDGVADVLIDGGIVARVGQDLALPDGAEVIDVTGRLLLPGLVEAHCHLDKTVYGGPGTPHSAGPSPADRIAKSAAAVSARSG